MKIKINKKKKNSLYEVLIDQEKINLYDDVIINNNLLLKKEITKDELDNILKENNFLEAYHKAINYINAKLRTEKEIRKRLQNYSKEVINKTIERLQKEGYLNDLNYIKAYTNDAINLKNIGPIKIKCELKKLGFKENDITNYLDTFKKDIWFDKINKYIKKRINSNHNLSAFSLKQKIIHELSLKGYSLSDINNLINEYEFVDDKTIYKKEYLKIKNKYSKKYSDEELEYRIKAYLRNKGFRE